MKCWFAFMFPLALFSLPLAAADDEDAKLTAFFKKYLEDEFRQRPLLATQLGDHRFDHLLDDLASLKSHIMQASGINDTLRAWSEGMLGQKTFQQVSEEFAEIVIPKVWVREGKNISRVSECLSISPKKVRRILRSAGYLDSH